MIEKKPGSNTHRLYVACTNEGYGVYAVESIAAGQMFLQVEGELRERPSRFSLQVGWNLHIGVNESLSLEELSDRFPWRFLNHSCDGNSMVQWNCFVAIRFIHPGEEVTFNYNATEYELAYPFTCHCGSPFCTREIRGYKYLTPIERENLRPVLNSYLRNGSDLPLITPEDPVQP